MRINLKALVKFIPWLTPCAVVVISGCSTTTPCEDILEVKKQELQCKRLQATINSSKNPQEVTTARNRFQTECVDLRYYRDDYDTICKGEQQPIGQAQKSVPQKPQ